MLTFGWLLPFALLIVHFPLCCTICISFQPVQPVQTVKNVQNVQKMPKSTKRSKLSTLFKVIMFDHTFLFDVFGFYRIGCYIFGGALSVKNPFSSFRCCPMHLSLSLSLSLSFSHRCPFSQEPFSSFRCCPVSTQRKFGMRKLERRHQEIKNQNPGHFKRNFQIQKRPSYLRI